MARFVGSGLMFLCFVACNPPGETTHTVETPEQTPAPPTSKQAALEIGRFLGITNSVVEAVVLKTTIRRDALSHGSGDRTELYDAIEVILQVKTVLHGSLDKKQLTVVDLYDRCGRYQVGGQKVPTCMLNAGNGRYGLPQWEVGQTAIVFVGRRPAGCGVYRDETRFSVLVALTKPASRVLQLNTGSEILRSELEHIVALSGGQ